MVLENLPDENIELFYSSYCRKGSVNGFDVIEQSMEVRKLVGYLPENNPLYTDMYVAEYLRFIAGIHKLGGKSAATRIDELIHQTGLSLEVNKKIGALSKGYRQRVGLAQAMMHNPEVWSLMNLPAVWIPINWLTFGRWLNRLEKRKR